MFYLFMYLLPKNLLSTLVGKLVSYKRPKWFVKKSVTIFAQIFKIDSTQALKPINEYENIQEFFARKLKHNARSIDKNNNVLISPCDGYISQLGKINNQTLIQAKGKNYTLLALLKNKDLAKEFINGYYCTVYLSPKDYHRFHMPINGNIYKTIYYPGYLWPVNFWSVNNVNELFCQNERTVSLIKSESNQVLAFIAVAATMVGKISLTYTQIQDRKAHKFIEQSHENICLAKGEELGKFMFGSTIILLFNQNMISKFAKTQGEAIKMGEKLAFCQI
jgi:phosphatidylserine decarboxylase